MTTFKTADLGVSALFLADCEKAIGMSTNSCSFFVIVCRMRPSFHPMDIRLRLQPLPSEVFIVSTFVQKSLDGHPLFWLKNLVHS
jgi:hypothetical protein